MRHSSLVLLFCALWLVACGNEGPANPPRPDLDAQNDEAAEETPDDQELETDAVEADDHELLPPGICGNTLVEAGEYCDDGNTNDGDGCAHHCRQGCGDGLVQASQSEFCDDGNTVGGDGCSPDCLQGCGDEVVQPLLGENCDDGNSLGGDGCSSRCRREECGNDVVDPGEQCDGESWCDAYCLDLRVDPPDDDGDGLNDRDEGRESNRDTDGDGTPDYRDDDSDGDGIADVDEAGDDDPRTPPLDTDNDGTPDFRDDDADGDGLLDQAEGQIDTDGDGLPDYRDLDSDGDGVSDLGETEADADGDGAPNYLDPDSDGDGIFDAIEGGDDSDLDGTPDFLDLDCDGDGFDDVTEAVTPTSPIDTDGDGTPDFKDHDSDNDSLPDAIERENGTEVYQADSDGDTLSDLDDGLQDGDGDGLINARDDDSDGDGFSDRVEAGDALLSTPGIDTDGDTYPDFRDLDSDADGLLDRLELACPALGKHSRLYPDTDADGFSDLAEEAVGSDLCNPAQGVTDLVEFYFELPNSGPLQSDQLEFRPTVKKADVFFSVDTTQTMDGEINVLKSSINAVVISGTSARVSDAAFGVAAWEDFPVCGWGLPGDLPWRLIGAPTTNVAQAEQAVAQLVARSGGDLPEAGYESLYQLATGNGVSWGANLPGCTAQPAGDVPPNHTGNGGVGFRDQTVPIVLHVTDASSHDGPEYQTKIPGAHAKGEALSALDALGIRVITVQSGGDATVAAQLDEIAASTDAVVPVCAFKSSAVDWRCGADQCCTGVGGAPVAPDASSNCVLRYGINSNGSGLGETSVDGIDALIKYGKFDVFVSVRDDASTPVDTTCFVKRVEASGYVAPALEPEASCTPQPVPAAFAGSPYNNGFTGFATGTSSTARPGAQLLFLVQVQNDGCALPTTEAQVFDAFLDIIDQATGSILDTQTITIIVPPEIEQQG